MAKVTNAQLKTLLETGFANANENFKKAKQEVNALDLKIDGLTASDFGALADTVKYGSSLHLEMNSETYVITASLKDQDGNVLGTAQTIDIPLETVVVSGAYDAQTKKVVLTLKNGSTVDFSVADLITGLQSEITAANKLDADLIDDTNSANKFITAAEKTAYAGKQDAITAAAKLDADLVDDASSTHKFVTAAEKTAIADIENKTTMAAVEAKGYQTADDVNTALNDVLAGLTITPWAEINITE